MGQPRPKFNPSGKFLGNIAFNVKATVFKQLIGHPHASCHFIGLQHDLVKRIICVSNPSLFVNPRCRAMAENTRYLEVKSGLDDIGDFTQDLLALKMLAFNSNSSVSIFNCFRTTGPICLPLLHHFRKKSQKTPPREIEKARAERDDYLARKGSEKQ